MRPTIFNQTAARQLLLGNEKLVVAEAKNPPDRLLAVVTPAFAVADGDVEQIQRQRLMAQPLQVSRV